MAGLQLFFVMSCFIGLLAVAGTIEYSDIEDIEDDVSVSEFDADFVSQIDEYMSKPLD